MADVDADSLVFRLLDGDETAWPALWERIETKLLVTLRRPYFLGSMSQREDDCRNIVVEVMAKLRVDDYARLRAYVETKRRKPGIAFMAWLLVVAKRVAIDYMRAHEEYIDRRREEGASRPGEWRAIDTLIADSRAPGARPTITNDAAAREIAAMALTLPHPQREALGEWLAGRDYAEIASGMKLPSGKDAERLVRAGLERLRRQVRKEELS